MEKYADTGSGAGIGYSSKLQEFICINSRISRKQLIYQALPVHLKVGSDIVKDVA